MSLRKQRLPSCIPIIRIKLVLSISDFRGCCRSGNYILGFLETSFSSQGELAWTARPGHVGSCCECPSLVEYFPDSGMADFKLF